MKAFDQTYKGKVDLSEHVVVGEPIKKGHLRWSVPYDVTDDAGNRATTVWRDVVVEEDARRQRSGLGVVALFEVACHVPTRGLLQTVTDNGEKGANRRRNAADRYR